MGGLFDKGGLEEARIVINQVEERREEGNQGITEVGWWAAYSIVWTPHHLLMATVCNLSWKISQTCQTSFNRKNIEDLFSYISVSFSDELYQYCNTRMKGLKRKQKETNFRAPC